MVEKKSRKKKDDFDDFSPAEPLQPQNLEHRFGAVAFVEDIAEDDDAEILSLDSLREAFAALTDEEPVKEEPKYDPEYGEEIEEITDEPEESVSPQIEIKSNDEPTIEPSPRTILEAMLFVGDRNNRPLTAERAAEKMRNVSSEEIAPIVVSLNRDYAKLGCPYMITEEKDGYRMVLRPEFEPILTKFYGKIREARLSQQAIDTLAVVAYRQPITADEVQKLRKQPSSTLLNQLVRRGLLEIEQRIQEKKKTIFYRTTDRFLELFQLESLDDLPISEEIKFR